MKIFYTFAFFGLLLSGNAVAEPANCVSKKTLLDRAALIEQYSRGKGSAVLYESDLVLTNHHVIEDVEKPWVFIPKLQRSISATVVYSTPKPDIAILRLNEKVPNVEKLTLGRNVTPAQQLRFVSFPFGDKSRLGVTNALFNSNVRFSKDMKTLYFNAFLADWAYAGDSGGPFFNCKGDVMGLNFGNLVLQGEPEHIYGVNARALEDALKAAGLEARRRR